MNPTKSSIEAIASKVNSLMESYDLIIDENLKLEMEREHLKERNRQLETERQALMNRLNSVHANNAQLKLEIAGLKKLKLQHLTDVEQESLNALIGDYIGEVDKCITLLESLS